MLSNEQRLKRKQGLGASDSPIVMGYSTYKTPYQLYMEKTGTVDDDNETVTEQQYWGNALESVILARFSEDHDVTLKTGVTVHHPDYPFIFANLDGWEPKSKTVVEAKCVNSFQRKEWDMDLNDGIPMSYLIQIAKQCVITDATRGYCAVLIGGMEYKEFIYERDKALEDLIIQSDIEFWNCVQNKIEPAPMNTDDCRLKYPTPNPDKIVHSTFKSYHHLNSLMEYKAKIKSLNEKEEMSKMHLMSHMGDAEYLVGQDGELLVTWKANKKGTRVFNIK